jgi:signal transduction histidine kinase
MWAARYHERVTGDASIHHARIARMVPDLLVATATCAVSMIVMFNGGIGASRTGVAPPVVTTIALVIASTIPLVLRDRFPLAVFAVTAAATALTAAAVFPIGLPLGPGIGLYTVAVHRPRLSRVGARRTGVVAAGFALYLGGAALHLSRAPWAEALHGGLLWTALWFAGERTRLQHQQIDDLTRAAARERHLAAVEERTRIARDLHDSAGHAINVIAIRAGAARLRHHDDPDRSLAALLTIEELARHTAADIDRFVGALRADGGAGDPPVPHSLSSIGSLLELHAEAGLTITVRTTGEPRPLRPSVDQAAYRIVQEALTNASRHGTGTGTLSIEHTDSTIAITLTNPTLRTDRRPLGNGLLGATERATQLGGTLHTELSDATFTLWARLPADTPTATSRR